MFQENKAKRSPMQIVGIVVIFVLAVLIVLTFVLFGIFKDSNSAPKLFGRRVYVVTNDRMEPRIPEGAAVFVEEGSLPQPGSQSVILCNIEGNLYVIGYIGTETSESGSARYIVKYDNASDDRTWGISQSDIIGVAQTYDEFFGWVIRFASSKAGMMIIVIIPCLLVIIYEVVMLLLSRKNADSDEKWRKSSSEKDPAAKDGWESLFRKAVGPGPEDIPPERNDIHVPVDEVKEERFVEKQLRRANDKLNTTVLEASGVGEPEEIKLDSIDVEPEMQIRKAATSADLEIEKPELPAAEKKPISIGDLSASRIDELIKLLEEEKKRLGDN